MQPKECKNLEATETVGDAALGGHHTLFSVFSKGVGDGLRACGAGWQGQMGDNKLDYNNAVDKKPILPTEISKRENVSSLTCGYYHNLVRMQSGKVWWWGCNENRQLGASEEKQLLSPAEADLSKLGGQGIKSIDGGYCHTAGVDLDGKVWTWGCGAQGQRGLPPEDSDGNEIPLPIQNKVVDISNASQVVSGNHHNLVLTDSGQVYAFGSNEYGQCMTTVGEDDVLSTPSKVHLPLLLNEKVTHISAGICHSAAQTSKGRILLWGCGMNGQTADETLPDEGHQCKILDMKKIAVRPP